YGRGVDRLPVAVTGPLAEALARSLDELELRRSLAVATACLIGELEAWDPALCARLRPLLHEFGARQAVAERGRSPRGLAVQEGGCRWHPSLRRRPLRRRRPARRAHPCRLRARPSLAR